MKKSWHTPNNESNFSLVISYKEIHKDFRITFRTISVLCDKINDSDNFLSHLFADYSLPITEGLRKHFKSLPIRKSFCWAQLFLTSH
jgi:hypothetical protein